MEFRVTADFTLSSGIYRLRDYGHSLSRIINPGVCVEVTFIPLYFHANLYHSTSLSTSKQISRIVKIIGE